MGRVQSIRWKQSNGLAIKRYYYLLVEQDDINEYEEYSKNHNEKITLRAFMKKKLSGDFLPQFNGDMQNEVVDFDSIDQSGYVNFERKLEESLLKICDHYNNHKDNNRGELGSETDDNGGKLVESVVTPGGLSRLINKDLDRQEALAESFVELSRMFGQQNAAIAGGIKGQNLEIGRLRRNIIEMSKLFSWGEVVTSAKLEEMKRDGAKVGGCILHVKGVRFTDSMHGLYDGAYITDSEFTNVNINKESMKNCILIANFFDSSKLHEEVVESDKNVNQFILNKFTKSCQVIRGYLGLCSSNIDVSKLSEASNFHINGYLSKDEYEKYKSDGTLFSQEHLGVYSRIVNEVLSSNKLLVAMKGFPFLGSSIDKYIESVCDGIGGCFAKYKLSDRAVWYGSAVCITAVMISAYNVLDIGMRGVSNFMDVPAITSAIPLLKVATTCLPSIGMIAACTALSMMQSNSSLLTNSILLSGIVGIGFAASYMNADVFSICKVVLNTSALYAVCGTSNNISEMHNKVVNTNLYTSLKSVVDAKEEHLSKYIVETLGLSANINEHFNNARQLAR